jgi:hypothetical protein
MTKNEPRAKKAKVQVLVRTKTGTFTAVDGVTAPSANVRADRFDETAAAAIIMGMGSVQNDTMGAATDKPAAADASSQHPGTDEHLIAAQDAGDVSALTALTQAPAVGMSGGEEALHMLADLAAKAEPLNTAGDDSAQHSQHAESANVGTNFSAEVIREVSSFKEAELALSHQADSVANQEEVDMLKCTLGTLPSFAASKALASSSAEDSIINSLAETGYLVGAAAITAEDDIDSANTEMSTAAATASDKVSHEASMTSDVQRTVSVHDGAVNNVEDLNLPVTGGNLGETVSGTHAVNKVSSSVTVDEEEHNMHLFALAALSAFAHAKPSVGRPQSTEQNAISGVIESGCIVSGAASETTTNRAGAGE